MDYTWLIACLCVVVAVILWFQQRSSKSKRNPFKGGKAVVVGGGVSGLANAAVCALHFEEVIILDQDEVEKFDEGIRPGVPQSGQIHSLQAGGAMEVEDWLPGFEDHLLKEGASRLQYGSDMLWYFYGTVSSTAPQPYFMLGSTRAFFEKHLRYFLLKTHPNVKLISGARIKDYITNESQPEPRDVVGVTYRMKKGVETIDNVDLLIECSGRRGGALKRWESLGCDTPKHDEIIINVIYRTSIVKYENPEKKPKKDLIIVATDPPHQKKMGMLLRSENDTYQLLLASWCKEYLPTEFSELAEVAKEIEIPEFSQLYDHATCLRGPSQYLFPSSVRYHYVNCKRKPNNVVIAGDAIASFNPGFGQGMTVATKGARCLDDELSSRAHSKSLKGFCDSVLKRHEVVVESAWTLVSAVDLAFPEAEGERNSKTEMVFKFNRRLLACLHLSSVVSAFTPTVAMVNAFNPLAAFHPVSILAVIGNTLGLIKGDNSQRDLI